jgi:hypothetical protein
MPMDRGKTVARANSCMPQPLAIREGRSFKWKDAALEVVPV